MTLSGPAKTPSVLFIVLLAANIALALSCIFSYSTNILALEFNVIYTVQASLADSTGIYQNPEQIPFAVTQYMPFYYIISNKIASILSLTPGEDVYSIYLICRSLSFAATILMVLFLFKILNRVFEFDFRQSLFLASLALVITAPWFYLVRPDAFVSLFSTAALYLFLRYLKNEPEQNYMFLFFSGFLCFFSFFTKQSGLITFLILSSFLLIKLKLKDLAVLTAGFVLGLAAGYVLYIPYSSPYLLDNIISGINNGIHVKGAIFKPFKGLLTKFGMLFFIDIAALYFLLKKAKLKKYDKKTQLAIYYFVLIFVYSFFASFKKGAGIHYFNDFYIVSLIILPISFSRFNEHYDLESHTQGLSVFKKMSYYVLLFFAFSITIANHYQYGYGNFLNIRYHDNLYDRPVVSFIKNEIKKDKDLLIIDSTGSRLFINRFPENAVFSHPHIVRCCTFPLKVFDYSGFKEKVVNGDIKFYISEENIKDFINVDLIGNFTFYTRISGFNIFINNTNLHNRP